MTFDEIREAALGVVGGAAGLLVHRLHISRQEAREGDGATGRGEGTGLPRLSLTADPQTHRGAARVGHLRSDRALPDQLVQPELVGLQRRGDLTRCPEGLARRPDGLVRLLRVLHLAGVLPRRRMDEVGPIEITGLVTGGCDGRLGQRGRVGTHVGDVAVLVQPLCHPHGAVGGEPEFAAGLLLQGRRHERRVRAARVGLLLDRRDRHRGALEP